jgi:WD40 repeat protein
MHVIDLDDVSNPARIPARSGRRVAWLAGDRVLVAPYLGAMRAWHAREPEPSPQAWPGVHMIDMESDPDRRAATALEFDGTISRITAEPGSAARTVAERPGALAVAGSDAQIIVVTATTLEILEPDGQSRTTVPIDLPVTELALAPDGRRLALGCSDGSVWVWSTDVLEPLAVLRGHSNRISALAFADGGDWLLTGSWDGDTRQWSMRTLERSPTDVLAEAEAAWGLTLAALLEARAGEM